MSASRRPWLLALMVLSMSATAVLAEDDDDDRKPAAPKAPSASPSSATSPETRGGGDRVTLSPEVIAHYRIASGPVERRAVGQPIAASASVGFDADTVVDVGTPVGGRVQGIAVHLGDTVAPGDVLLTIESQDLGQAQDALLERIAARVTAEADAALAQATWERSRPLAADHTISTGEAQRRESELRKAQATLAAATTAVASAENALRLFGMEAAAITELTTTRQVSPRLAIRAPSKGTVIARSVTTGEIVRPDQEALLVLADVSTYWVVANVPVSAARLVRVGDPARITATGSAETVSARVDFVPPALDPQSHALPVRIAVPASSGLRPGMFASASISAAIDGAAPIVVVPRSAVFSYGGGDVVFVPVPDAPGSFRAKRVVTGPPEGDAVPIVSGIDAGEQVVVTGGFIIKAELSKGPADED